MELGITQCQAVNLLQPGEFRLVLRRGHFQILARIFIILHLLSKHSVVDKPDTAKCLCKQFLLSLIRVNPKTVYVIHAFLSPTIPCIGA